MHAKKRALGRGLDVLLGGTIEPPASNGGNGGSDGKTGSAVIQVAIHQLNANPYQPRHHFDPQTLEELASSIKEKGILQPLVVRRHQKGYDIVAGERRWRAAQRVGLESVPAIVRDYSDQEMLELALIENLQRDDLNPVEEALAYRQMINMFELTQEQVAERVGKSRVAVTNALRLLRLPQQILDWIIEDQISAGHARALLSLETESLQMALAREIMQGDLNVREAERRVRQVTKAPDPQVKARQPDIQIDISDLQEKMCLNLGLQVKILPRSNTSGKVEVYYSSLDEFQRLFDHLGITLE